MACSLSAKLDPSRLFGMSSQGGIPPADRLGDYRRGPTCRPRGDAPDPCRGRPGNLLAHLGAAPGLARGWVHRDRTNAMSQHAEFLLSIDSHVSRNDPRGTHQCAEHRAYTSYSGV
jgi:hypothetical protein